MLANLVTKMNHKGKKGDYVHIPTPARLSASAKAENAVVTVQAYSATNTGININKHYEYSTMIEDILDVQGLSQVRSFYTDDAGYALAKQIDLDLFTLSPWFQSGTDADDTGVGSIVQANDGTTAFSSSNAATLTACYLTDAGIRKMIQTLDDNDVPTTDRALVIPPIEKKNLTGLARFTEQAFVGEGGGANTIRTGMIGNVYGVEVYVSTNCPWILVDNTGGEAFGHSASTSGSASTDFYGRGITYSGTATANKFRQGLLLHKGAMVLVEQQSVRTQTQYKQEYLANLFTADTVYGVGELRDTSAVGFASYYA